jgi:beta-glucosidase
MGANDRGDDGSVGEADAARPSSQSEQSDQPPSSDPGVGGFDPAGYRMGIVAADTEHMAAAHRLAVQAIKAESGQVKTGWTLALVDFQPAEGGEERWAYARRVAQTDWLDISADDDFVGVQTYSRTRIGPEGQLPPPEGAATMQTGWEVYPDALGHTVRLAAETAGVPVLVTENGMATDDDAARQQYTRSSLEGLAQVMADGVDVRGYLHWTLLDNFEWTAGYTKTFGLIGVDRETFVRTVKPSARWLGQVARRNALD